MMKEIGGTEISLPFIPPKTLSTVIAGDNRSEKLSLAGGFFTYG
jgi:hypothetical protein